MPYKFKRISQNKVNKILRSFASDISATQAAEIAGVNRNTINDWHNSFRKKIAEYQERENGSFHGEYDGLVLDGYKHKRINHSKECSNGKGTHVNGIENFWSFAKRRLAKFNGVSRKTFYFHLKECEFRYNRKHDILDALKRIIRSLLV